MSIIIRINLLQEHLTFRIKFREASYPRHMPVAYFKVSAYRSANLFQWEDPLL